MIDHPLDPENTRLSHVSIEAPQPDLLYRGRVTLSQGRAVVSIDGSICMFIWILFLTFFFPL